MGFPCSVELQLMNRWERRKIFTAVVKLGYFDVSFSKLLRG
jgi:hypothetical protein